MAVGKKSEKGYASTNTAKKEQVMEISTRFSTVKSSQD